MSSRESDVKAFVAEYRIELGLLAAALLLLCAWVAAAAAWVFR